jgi:2-polyprenyl-6-methoxyphenol hydroxylase-like FAD-dependent oxidoreductase
MARPFDVIVVGARCAGAPAAMLLARRGLRVLLVDRATFPSDTISTHLIHPPGVAALKRWNLLEKLVATGCPPIRSYSFDMGPFVITGAPGSADTADVAYAPRRTVLDKLLIDAAAGAGVEVREGYVVDEILMDHGRVTGILGHSKNGAPAAEHAQIVVGADGLHSMVAKAVSAEQYNERAPLQAGYYSYWSGLPMDGRLEGYDTPHRAFAAWPTHDDLTLIVASWPMAEFEANKADVEGNFLKTIATSPRLSERVRAARREERFLGLVVPGFFRKPFGPGWALVGDAGYNKDFITAQGISDAFRSAELCTDAIDDAFAGRSTFDAAMTRYQTSRDEKAMPTYEFTNQFAALAPPPPEMQQLMAAVHGNQEAMNGFVQVFAGIQSPSTFFSQENVGRIFAAAQARSAAH